VIEVGVKKLHVVYAANDNFYGGAYNMEGDDALVFCCYDILSLLKFGIQVEHYPNLIAVATRLGGTRTQQLIQYGSHACNLSGVGTTGAPGAGVAFTNCSPQSMITANSN